MQGDSVAPPHKHVRPSTCVVRRTPHMGDFGAAGGECGEWGKPRAPQQPCGPWGTGGRGSPSCQAQPWAQGPSAAWTDPSLGIWLKLPPWLCSGAWCALSAGWMATSFWVMEDRAPQLFVPNKPGLFFPAALRKCHTQGSVLYRSWIIQCYVLSETRGKRKCCSIPWESKSWIHREKYLTNDKHIEAMRSSVRQQNLQQLPGVAFRGLCTSRVHNLSSIFLYSPGSHSPLQRWWHMGQNHTKIFIHRCRNSS